jgi:hypothetical protein
MVEQHVRVNRPRVLATPAGAAALVRDFHFERTGRRP